MWQTTPAVTIKTRPLRSGTLRFGKKNLSETLAVDIKTGVTPQFARQVQTLVEALPLKAQKLFVKDTTRVVVGTDMVATMAAEGISHHIARAYAPAAGVTWRGEDGLNRIFVVENPSTKTHLAPLLNHELGHGLVEILKLHEQPAIEAAYKKDLIHLMKAMPEIQESMAEDRFKARLDEDGPQAISRYLFQQENHSLARLQQSTTYPDSPDRKERNLFRLLIFAGGVNFTFHEALADCAARLLTKEGGVYGSGIEGVNQALKSPDVIERRFPRLNKLMAQGLDPLRRA